MIIDGHTCIGDDGGTPNRKCAKCEAEKAPAPAVSGQTPTTLLEEADKWVADSGHWTKSDPHRCASNIILELATALRTALPSAPVASAPKEEELERQIAVYADAKAKGVLDLERCLCGLPAVATMPVLAEGFSLPVCRKHWKSSVPSTRTVTRYFADVYMNDPVRGLIPFRKEVYLASEVDPLLKELTKSDAALEAARRDRNSIYERNEELRALLAERVQEIERLKADVLYPFL